MRVIETKKDYRKLVSSVIQAIFLIGLLAILLHAFFVFQKYHAYQETSVPKGESQGFIAISYLGIDRKDNLTLTSRERLAKELALLRKNGYVTITQNDILNYYQKGIPLPEKSLFLMFEDGRRDSALFAQKTMEKNNYIATILTYANKMTEDEQEFLTPDELKKMKTNGFWEIGSNGYRLSYINVYDKQENFLGNLTSQMFQEKKDLIERDYNHYLMDYIRDQNRIPVESEQEMQSRITQDYEKMEEAYQTQLGEVPILYALMHANTGRFGNQEKVSKVNANNILKHFSMNFNREGYSYNTLDSSIYDLTRMQIQPYWYTNHMLMRIQDDNKLKMTFFDGNTEQKKKWDTIEGASEFSKDSIILTSLPKGSGILKLKGFHEKDYTFTATLKGNIIGNQGIYFRSDENRQNGILVQLCKETLTLYEIQKGEKKTLSSIPLATGEKEYQISDRGSHLLKVNLSDDEIQIWIDGKSILSQKIAIEEAGELFLETAFQDNGYSQRNLYDDVYDGVFENMDILSQTREGKNVMIYTNQLQTSEKLLLKTKQAWNDLVDWFIETF